MAAESSMDKILLTQKRLKELLSYDEDTGLFTWSRNVSSTGRSGGVAGCVDKTTGYRRVRLHKRLYHAHRLAWLYVHGEWPPYEVDHINGNRSDNRMANLRCATRVQNMHNNGRRIDNKSGFKGVCWYPSRNKWLAKIQTYGRAKNLGYYDNKDDAIAAYKAAAAELHGPFANLGGRDGWRDANHNSDR
jgi:hypothetical protein